MDSMETKTRDGMEMMGETGAGISSKDQINMEQPNQFTTNGVSSLTCIPEAELTFPHDCQI